MLNEIKSRSKFNQNDFKKSKKVVSVVISRNFRFNHNFAIYYGIELANDLNAKLELILMPCPSLFVSSRHVEFLKPIILELVSEAEKAGIQVTCVCGENYDQSFSELKKNLNDKSAAIIADYHPMPHCRDHIMSLLDLSPFCAVIEALNIYPIWTLSDHKEYSAATLRHKLKPHVQAVEEAKVPEYSTVKNRSKSSFKFEVISEYLTRNCDTSVAPLALDSTTDSAYEELEAFISDKLPHYAKSRNDPLAMVNSKMSKWLAFGVLTPQIIAEKVLSVNGHDTSKDMFLEELICRRELAENFVYYANSDLFSHSNFYGWTIKTLQSHQNDDRSVILTRHELEYGFSPSNFWNALQVNLIETGEMHGYVRMFWGKQPLKWTTDPLKTAEWMLLLNDKYAIDGSTPNSAVGVLWATRGLHDRAFGERPIYGKIRYMAESSLKRHFDLDEYLNHLKSVNSVQDGFLQICPSKPQ